MADIELPQLGESVTEGTITRWFKAIGDQVAEDEPLFEVSTDKVDSEVPSPVAGYLTEILVPEGDTVDVGTKLAVVSDAPGGAGGGADATPADASPADAPPADASPAVEAPAAAPEAAPAPAPAPAAAPAAAPPTASAGVLLSPVVRRLVDEAGLDPAAITGTGLGGRITRSDVEAHLRTAGPAPARPTPAPPGAGPARPARPAPARPAPPAPTVSAGSDAPVALNKIRRITAEHMVRSLETSAHAYVGTEVDYEAVERVRRTAKASFKAEEGVSLTYLPFVARALVDALAEFPQVNASMGEEVEQIVVHGSIHLGVAVDLDHEGLIVPVVHDVQDQRLRAIARNVADLADRARARALTADDITGGTVTITNIGSTGNAFLLPVINQPQVMILSTDGVTRKPVVVTDGDGAESIAIRSVGNLTLGWDHRAFDGAYAAQFLARVRDILETRDWSAEL
jgi:2-oxoglutarate dehydrogenase E2 component (dihydrolipoamide succinyltransferase)